MENTETNAELWQVEAGGQVYETSFAEMQNWIAEGSLLRIDRVRKGNLRWIEAGKVPTLIEFFNAKDAAEPTAPVVTTSSTEILGVSETPAPSGGATIGTNPTFGHTSQQTGPEPCSVHTDAPAAYLCDTCANFFCKACPSSYGGSVKICPFCGAMCGPVAKAAQVQAETQRRSRAATEGFGFGDFTRALGHPFRFKVSLFFGALLFALFSLGQAAASIGGIFLMASALFCFMFANMLTFGVLGNVADNFSQGKLDENFMPSFDDFSIWDDILHPFFLSIGVYLSSFGPLIAVFLVAFFLVLGEVRDELKSDANAFGSTDLKTAQKQLNEEGGLRDLANKQKEIQDRRTSALNDVTEADKAMIEAIDGGDVPKEIQQRQQDARTKYQQDEEKYFDDLNRMIGEQRKAQLESVIGPSPETKAKEQAAMFQQLLNKGLLLLMLLAAALLWGLFYFPAACTVAGYTRSFTATINPLVGLDTIKRLGSDYVKLLAMGVAILVMSAVISTFLNAILVAFDLPAVGNVPAAFIGAFFTFYFSVVFSCIIGYMLFKAADRLELYSR